METRFTNMYIQYHLYPITTNFKLASLLENPLMQVRVYLITTHPNGSPRVAGSAHRATTPSLLSPSRSTLAAPGVVFFYGVFWRRRGKTTKQLTGTERERRSDARAPHEPLRATPSHAPFSSPASPPNGRVSGKLACARPCSPHVTIAYCACVHTDAGASCVRGPRRLPQHPSTPHHSRRRRRRERRCGRRRPPSHPSVHVCGTPTERGGANIVRLFPIRIVAEALGGASTMQDGGEQ